MEPTWFVVVGGFNTYSNPKFEATPEGQNISDGRNVRRYLDHRVDTNVALTLTSSSAFLLPFRRTLTRSHFVTPLLPFHHTPHLQAVPFCRNLTRILPHLHTFTHHLVFG